MKLPESNIVRSLFVVVTLGSLCLGAPALAQIERNQTLEQALERLIADGHEIFYSSDLVRPWMRVREAPPADATVADALSAILAPYRLTVQHGPNGTLLLVRAAPVRETDTGRIAGLLLRQSDGRPIVGAQLAVGDHPVTTDAAGRFELSSLPPGRYIVGLDTSSLELVEPYVAVVREKSTTTLELAALDHSRPDLEEVLVNASQYRLVRGSAPSISSFSAADLQLIPDLGDDPLRAVGRLPGTTSNAFSAKVNMRGGEADETLVRFDDLRLYNPFHLKDFHSLFSSIDPSVVKGVDVYTGGFPAAFGDRMSGVIDIDPLLVGRQPRRELSVSFFNSSGLLSGTVNNDQGEWLVSARRGHLDKVFNVVNPKLGEPSYKDYYARFGHRLGDAWSATASFLQFDDNISLSDGDDEELASASYRDRYYWLRLDYEPHETFWGSMIAARSKIRSRRSGVADQSGVSEGWLEDRRNFEIDSLQADAQWRISERLLLQFGSEWRTASARYDYADEVAFVVLVDHPGAPSELERSRDLSLAPRGKQYGVYANLRLEAQENLTLDAGLRWDRETLSSERDDQVSPRISALYRLPDGSSLRGSWGRYFQAQSINELQISDGVMAFAPAQRADHWVLGYERPLSASVNLRVEAYRKTYSNLRPRFENLLNSFVLLPELKPDRVLVAPQSAKATGAEISLRHESTEAWSWWASYAISSAKDRIDGVETRRAWDNRHSLNAGLAWRGERWDFSVAASVASGWPTTEFELVQAEPFGIVGAGARNEITLGTRASLDARVARHFSLANDSTLTLFFEVSNLTDRFNTCCVEFEYTADEEDDEPLSFDTEPVRDLPIFPSIGLIWRF